jgi:hypothetical protein
MPILDSNNSANDKVVPPADNTSLAAEGWNFVKNHPTETAVGAGLAVGAIVVSRGRAIAAAEREIAPLARAASERSTLNLSSGAIETMPNAAESLSASAQLGYRHVPWTPMAASVRAQKGAVVEVVDGPSRIVFGKDSSVQHILANRATTIDERVNLTTTAAYAELIKSDVLAAEAASAMPQRSFAGILQSLGRKATPEQMQQNAVVGAKAYVEGSATGANRFTSYLTERYGPVTSDSLDLGRKLSSNAHPSDLFANGMMTPATRVLTESGIPITGLNRALAANLSVLRAEPWMRRSAIEGGAEYMQALAQRSLPEGANRLVQDAWFGNRAQALPPEVVQTIAALVQGVGKEACRDVSRVESVAQMVGANAKSADYVAAYRALEQGEAVIKKVLLDGKDFASPSRAAGLAGVVGKPSGYSGRIDFTSLRVNLPE